MKRKMTELERQLIDSGWCLTHKNYKGKLAKRIDTYVYKRLHNGFDFELYLNAKRDTIVELKIHNPYYYAGIHELSLLNETYEDVSSELKCLCSFVDTMKESALNDKV